MRRLDRIAAACLVFAVALVAYATALGGGFLFDDLHAIRDNESLRSIANVPSFFWDPDAFSSIDMRMYRPVLLVTLTVDWVLSDGAAWLFKLTNVLIHGACAVLLFDLARRLRAQFAPAFVVAMLFAAHPMAAEAINLVSSRSDQLMVLGLLLGMRLHFGAVGGSKWALAGTAVAAAIACGAKETGVMLPATLAVLEFVRARRRPLEWRAAAIRLAPSTVVVVAYLLARRAVFGVATVAVPKLTGGGDVINGAGRDLSTQLCAMTYVLPKFARQALAPFDLSADPYVPLDGDWLRVSVIAGVGLLALLTWAGLRAPRRRPGVFVGTCLAWATALPWVLIPLNMPAAEHRFYGGLAGIALVTAALLPSRFLRCRSGHVIAGLAIATFVAGSVQRSMLYHDPLELWQDCLDRSPHSIRGLCGRAVAYRDRAYAAGRAGDEATFVRFLRMACDDVKTVVRRQPTYATAGRNLCEFLLQLGPERGEPLTALVTAEHLLERKPDNPFYRLLKSRSLVQLAQHNGDERFFSEAEEVALSVLDVAEPKGLVFRQAAQVRVAMGDPEGAIAHLDRSVAMGLDHSSVLLDRCELLLEVGRWRDARADIDRVLGVDPFEPRAQHLMQRLRARPRPR